VFVLAIPSPVCVKIGAGGAVGAGGTVPNVLGTFDGEGATDFAAGFDAGFAEFAFDDDELPPPPPAIAAMMITTITTAPAIAHHRRHHGVAEDFVGVGAAGGGTDVGPSAGVEDAADAADGALRVGASVL
jgi:hypothetical protein